MKAVYEQLFGITDERATALLDELEEEMKGKVQKDAIRHMVNKLVSEERDEREKITLAVFLGVALVE